MSWRSSSERSGRTEASVRWSCAHANFIGCGGQRIVKETRHHAHLPNIRGAGLARLRVGFRLPKGDDDALARVGVRQHLKAFKAPLLLQNRRQTLGNTAHLHFHIRRKPDARHPRVHDRTPTGLGNYSVPFLARRTRRSPDTGQVTSRSRPDSTSYINSRTLFLCEMKGLAWMRATA